MRRIITALFVTLTGVASADQPNVLFIAVDEADIHLWNMVIYSDKLFYYNHR